MKSLRKKFDLSFPGVSLQAKQAILATELVLLDSLSRTNALAGALTFNSVTVSGNLENTNILGGVIGLLLGVFTYVGLAMVIMGIAQFISAMHEDQPDKKTKSLTFALCGAVLASLKSILTAMNLIS